MKETSPVSSSASNDVFKKLEKNSRKHLKRTAIQRTASSKKSDGPPRNKSSSSITLNEAYADTDSEIGWAIIRGEPILEQKCHLIPG